MSSQKISKSFFNLTSVLVFFVVSPDSWNISEGPIHPECDDSLCESENEKGGKVKLCSVDAVKLFIWKEQNISIRRSKLVIFSSI